MPRRAKPRKVARTPTLTKKARTSTVLVGASRPVLTGGCYSNATRLLDIEDRIREIRDSGASPSDRLEHLRALDDDLNRRSENTHNELTDFLAIQSERSLTDGEIQRHQRALNAADAQIAERTTLRAARLDIVRELASNPAHIQSGDGARHDHVDFQAMRRGGDPWVGEFRGQSDVELRDRALYAAERNTHVTDDMAAIVDELTQDETDTSNVAARWAITTSRPAYRSAFEKYLRHPSDVALYLEDAERDALRKVDEVRTYWNEATGNQGGFAVPIDYDLNLQVINSGSRNPFREISTVKATVSNLVYGLSSAGVTASWNTESNEASDATPTLAQPQWRVHKANAWLAASFEAIQDSDLGAEVGMLFADGKANLEADAFATGTGGGQPYGVVTRCASLGAYVFGDSGSTVEKDIVISDLYAMSDALPERHQDNATWVMHRTIANKIRRFGEGTTGSNSAFWTDLGSGAPPLLLGYPVRYSSAMDSVIASGSEDNIAVLGDFRAGYRIYDRVGTSLIYQPLVMGANRLPTGQAGWYLFFRTAGDVVDQTAASHFKLLHR